jgi:hypothetical protein
MITVANERGTPDNVTPTVMRKVGAVPALSLAKTDPRMG